jgi:tripartite-type tricarboxylate transporter receptor subunit TctC
MTSHTSVGRRIFLLNLAGAAFLPCAAFAQRQAAGSYPDAPIRIVVPFSAGGGNDLIARIVGQKLADEVGQPAVIENKPGASAIVGTQFVARSPADGYTLLMGASGNMTVNPAVLENLPYAPQKDFVPISMLASYPLFLVVSSASTLRTVRDLVDFSKAHPDKANYANPTSAFQIATELFKIRTGAKLTSIPYKGGGDAVNAIVGNQVTCAFLDPGSIAGQMKGGTLRPLATTSKERWPEFPDVPTLGDAGVPDADMELWMGLFAPAGTSQAIIDQLQAGIHAVIASPDVRERMKGYSVNPISSTSKTLSELMSRDIERYTEIAKAANIRSKA